MHILYTKHIISWLQIWQWLKTVLVNPPYLEIKHSFPNSVIFFLKLAP